MKPWSNLCISSCVAPDLQAYMRLKTFNILSFDLGKWVVIFWIHFRILNNLLAMSKTRMCG